MSDTTIPKDHGRGFPFIGEVKIRAVLADTNVSDKDKDDMLRKEHSNVADYYNWVFDRRQERINERCEKTKTTPSSSSDPRTSVTTPTT